MPAPREIELKLDLEPADVAELRKTVLSSLGAIPSETTRLVSVYFDTNKRLLRKNGLSLRVRTDGGRFIQTVKADAGASAGLHARTEWEAEIDSQEPQLDGAADSPLSDILAGKRSRKRLYPVFETSIDRTLWMIETGAFAIEIAVDEGRIRAGATSVAVSEIELELKRGAPLHLFDLARRLIAQVPARLEVRTKAERGYALADARQPPAFKAEPVAMANGMTTAEAFQAVARNCIRQFRLNEPLLAERRSAAALHQARVAIRRLRSALSLFKECIADAALPQIEARLGVISGKLGDARNLDVYLGRCERLAAKEDGPGDGVLVAEVEGRREAAYEDVIATFASAGFRQLMLDLAAWVETGPWLTCDTGEQRDGPIEDFAVAILERHRRKVRRRGRDLKALTPHARHRVRIQAKKLRYATEFFAGLVASRKGRKRHEAFLAAIEKLQACLGNLNDIEAGKALAADMLRDMDRVPRANPRDLAFAIGHISGRQTARGRRLLRRSRAAYDTFATTARFWVR